MNSAYYGYFNIFEYLLKVIKCDPFINNKNKQTLLMVGCEENGNILIMEFSLMSRTEALSYREQCLKFRDET